MRTHPTVPIPLFQTESAALSALMVKIILRQLPKDPLAPRETRVLLVILAVMESLAILAHLAPLAPLAPLALAETSLLNILTTQNLVAHLFLAQ